MCVDPQRTYELIMLMTEFMIAERNASRSEWFDFSESYDIHELLMMNGRYPIRDIYYENIDTVECMLALRSQLRGS